MDKSKKKKMSQEEKLEKMMLKQDEAIITTLKAFLKEFDCAFYSLKEPVRQLEKYFDLVSDWDGVIYCHVKTPIGEFSHWYILDIDMADLQSIINWLKRYTENVLMHLYHVDV